MVATAGVSGVKKDLLKEKIQRSTRSKVNLATSDSPRITGQLLAKKFNLPSDESLFSILNTVPEKLILNFGRRLLKTLGLNEEVTSVKQVLDKLSAISSEGGNILEKTVALFARYASHLGSPASSEEIKQTLASLSDSSFKDHIIQLADRLQSRLAIVAKNSPSARKNESSPVLAA